MHSFPMAGSWGLSWRLEALASTRRLPPFSLSHSPLPTFHFLVSTKLPSLHLKSQAISQVKTHTQQKFEELV